MQLTTAQRLHQLMGLPIVDGKKQAHGDKNASTTKGGPGRYHLQGALKNSPKPSRGASAAFVLHRAIDAKRKRRERIKSLGGTRQFKRWERLHATEQVAS